MALNLSHLTSQLGSIGGISRCGQPGFCLLFALWDKAIQLNSPKFSISNIELAFKAGFVSNKRFFEVRKALKDSGFLEFESIAGSKSLSYYHLNTDLIGIAISTGEQVEIRTDNMINSRIDNGMDNRMDSRIDNGIDNGIDSGMDNSMNNYTDGSLKKLINSFSRRDDYNE